MTSKEVLKLLRQDGWYEKSQKGSHLQLIHDFKKGKVTVPMHSGDLNPATLNSILKQAGLKRLKTGKMDSLKTTDKEVVVLIVETGNSSLWGRVYYDDNLIVDEALSIEELQSKMRTLLLDFHDLDPKSYDFRIEYDLTAFFEKFDFLKITKVAELSGINGSLLRQYASGKKHPSAKQAAKIESAIKELASQLAEAHIYAH